MSNIDKTNIFSPKFNSDGLLPCIAVHDETGEILMLAYMNKEALAETQRLKEAVYYSRSRNKLWRKGETSGNTQIVKQILTDCDQDTILLRVIPLGDGNACHTGRKTCFYRRVDGDKLHFND